MKTSNLEKLNISLQDVIFKHGTYFDLNNVLDTNETDFYKLIFEFTDLGLNEEIKEENSVKIDIYKSIFNKLLKIEKFQIEFNNVLLQNKEKFFSLKNFNIVYYLLCYFKDQIHVFTELSTNATTKTINEDSNSIIKYITDAIVNFVLDKNSLIHFVCVEIYFEIDRIIIHENIIFESFSLKNLLDYMYKMSKDNSVIIIRLLDFIFRMIDYYNSYKQKNISINEENEINLKIKEYLKILSSKFFVYDLLKQLAFIEVLEVNLSNYDVILEIIQDIDFFNNLNTIENNSSSSVQSLIRKFNYFLSKFYAGYQNNNLAFPSSLLKNLLGISIQISEETKNFHFMSTIYENLFHNVKFFKFLKENSDPEKFDFLSESIMMLVNCYCQTDYKIKISVMGSLTIMFSSGFKSKNDDKDNFEHFSKRLIKGINEKFSTIQNDSGDIMKFVQILYKDFQQHDFEEYEIIFLNLISSILLIDEYFYQVLSFFDLILYLLNKRVRESEVCEKKYSIVCQIYNSDIFRSKAQEKIIQHFKDYINSGVY